MDAGRRRALVDRLRVMFPVGSRVPGGSHGTVVGVRENPTEAVLLLRWDQDPHLYGIPIALTDTRRELYYTDFEVTSDEEWLDSVGIGLTVMLDTGHRAGARRTQVDDYIELRDAGGWPVDQRFYLQDGHHDAALVAERLLEDGLDPTLALGRRSEGRLLTWLLCYENTVTGGPWVGHALVSRSADGGAVLEQVETLPDVPETVVLDLAYFACHAAAERGAREVTTGITNPVLALAGFREDERGGRVVGTDFLEADPDGARRLLERDRASGAPWGGTRDEAGRYRPTTFLRRLVRRLRHGR